MTQPQISQAKPITSKLTAKAVANLQKEIEKDLSVPDPSPKDFEKTVAKAKSATKRVEEHGNQ